jgi:inorganic pyrophosphatase
MDLPARDSDGWLNVVVETPRGSTAKFKYDDRARVMRLSRPLPAGLCYPYDWGFIPSTREADGDPLDAMVIWDGSSYPGVVITARCLAVLRVDQKDPLSGERQRNDRVLTAPLKTRQGSGGGLDTALRAQLEQFFAAAVAFEGKDLRLLGWGDAAEADALVRAAEVSAALRAEDREPGRHDRR